MIKAVIFDFDGVIADTYDLGRRIVKEIGHDVSEEDFKAHHDGNVFEKPKIPFTDETAKKYFEVYNENITNQKSFFTLDELKNLNLNHELFIISSNDERAIINFLSDKKITSFKEILGVTFHKSKVYKFQHVMKKYGLRKEECILITDTVGDILEANHAGIKSIAVDFGFHERERLEKGNPFRIVSNFKEMKEVIEEL